MNENSAELYTKNYSIQNQETYASSAVMSRLAMVYTKAYVAWEIIFTEIFQHSLIHEVFIKLNAYVWQCTLVERKDS